LDLEPLVTLQRPVAVAADPQSRTLFVAEQGRQVVRLDDGGATSVLDFRGELSSGNEQGLLGLAFSPDGAQLFTHHTDRAGDNVILRFDMVEGAPDPSTQVMVLRVPQLRSNHNGGHLAFGPDGNLWIGLGDGGGGGDPGDHGQNPGTLLGSMLRITPTDDGYAIPAMNPFANGGDGAPEVVMWGLRNPWRYSFDPATGDLWIGDVGQDRLEEVSVLRAADGGGIGANLGWNEMEGRDTYRRGIEPNDHHPPTVDYAQAGGRCSVTGGEVYRGAAIPQLVGAYVFGDFCSGELFALDSALDDPELLVLDITVPEVTSFGVDADGELLVLSRTGTVSRIVG
jgi:glucose/arabinose dehydrogenase